MSRPRALDRYVGLRLPAELHETVKKDAAALGMTVSEYLRSLASIRVVPRTDRTDTTDPSAPIYIVYDKSLYDRATRQLKAWGYHYDNCLHALNTIKARRYLPSDKADALFAKALGYLERIEEGRAEYKALFTELAERDGVIAKAKRDDLP